MKASMVRSCSSPPLLEDTLHTSMMRLIARIRAVDRVPRSPFQDGVVLPRGFGHMILDGSHDHADLRQADEHPRTWQHGWQCQARYPIRLRGDFSHSQIRERTTIIIDGHFAASLPKVTLLTLL